MKVSKFIIIIIIFLFAGTKGCHNTNHSSVFKVDCSKASIVNKIPDSPNITIISSRCDDYQFDKYHVKLALDIFIKYYSKTFELSRAEIWNLLSDLRIEVSAIPRTVHAAYSVDGKLLRGKVPVSGLALTKDWIWVEIKTKQIWSSSLIHELVHIIIWRQNNVHGDPDHEGKAFSGWTQQHTKIIKDINNMLLDAEI